MQAPPSLGPVRLIYGIQVADVAGRSPFLLLRCVVSLCTFALELSSVSAAILYLPYLPSTACQRNGCVRGAISLTRVHQLRTTEHANGTSSTSSSQTLRRGRGRDPKLLLNGITQEGLSACAMIHKLEYGARKGPRLKQRFRNISRMASITGWWVQKSH